MYKVPDRLQVVITDNDVDEILSIEVKESNKERWEIIPNNNVVIKDNSLLIEIKSRSDTSIDFRILASRKNEDETQYLLFENEYLNVLGKCIQLRYL